MRYIFRSTIALLLGLILILLLRNCGSELRETRRALTPVPLPRVTATRISSPRAEISEPKKKPIIQKVPTLPPTPQPPTPTPMPLGAGRIEGFVRHYRPSSADIIPYPQARVYALIAGKQVGGSLSDESGLFQISRLPVGSIELRVVVPTAYDYNYPSVLYLANGQSVYGVNILLEEEFAPDQVNISFSSPVSPEQAKALATKYGCQIMASDPKKNRYTFRIPPNKTVAAMIAILAGDAGISTASPNYYYSLRR